VCLLLCFISGKYILATLGASINNAIHAAPYSIAIEHSVCTVALYSISITCLVATVDASISKATNAALYSIAIECSVSTVALCSVETLYFIVLYQ